MLYVQLSGNETKYDLLFDEKLSDKIFTLIIKSYKKNTDVNLRSF